MVIHLAKRLQNDAVPQEGRYAALDGRPFLQETSTSVLVGSRLSWLVKISGCEPL
jgi:hypothetical protein